jgi:hypothetical protein
MVAAGVYQINEHQILQLTEEIHLQNPRVKQIYDSITDVRSEIDNHNFFTFGEQFSPHLNEICSNTIGKIAMKLLIANMKVNDEKISLEFGDDGDWFNDKIVSIDLSGYDASGKVKNPLCGIGRNRMEVVKKFDTITDALFHELCHALHKYSGREMKECDLLKTVYEGRHAIYWWTTFCGSDDEEVYNITGFYYDKKTEEKKLDPISCNMFDICANASDPESIIQRVFRWNYRDYSERGKTLDKIEDLLIDIYKYIERRP